MKTQVLKTCVAVIVALLMGAGAAAAAPGLGVSAGHDLDALWAAAQKSYELAREDAVLLLESRDVAINDAGQVTTTVHRVAWIGTAAGLRAHADLRVPWNSTTCTLEVTKLRTWREGRWWPDAECISETAVVHTLPYAVDHADDYTAMRETMLLHDGVELPCIMETAYTITERNLPAVDEVFVLAQRDPAVLVQLSVSAPASRRLHHAELNGAPAPVAAGSDGRQALTWSLRPASALRLPLTVKPAAFEPTVAWSTFGDERLLGDAWTSAFWEAAVAPRAVVDSLRAVARESSGDRDRVEKGGRWLAAAVRLIHHDERWWAFAPRPATRTWETGYGHVLDRAVLWASLLKADGWQVLPVLADAVGAPAAPGLPHLAGRGRLLLHIQGGPDAPSRRPILVCDPEAFTVSGESVLDGRPLLWLSGEVKPQPPRGEGGDLVVELSLAAGDSAWTGSGWISGRGLLAFTDRVGGAPGDLAKHAKAVVSGVLAGATTPTAGLTMLVRSGSDLRCDVSLPLGKADDRGTRKLLVGRPVGGLLDNLPRDGRLGEESRATPVLLGGPLRQTVVLRLRLPADVTVTKPADRALANAAGRFSLVVTEADGWLEYRRELQFEASAGAAHLWPALRALLLEEADAANGTLTWRPAAQK